MPSKRKKFSPECQTDAAVEVVATGASSSVRVAGGGAAGGADAEGSGGRGGPASLPCLYSNNGIDEGEKIEAVRGLASILSPYHKRQAYALFENVQRLIGLAPSIGHIGFLTLTTPDNCQDAAEFRKRWHSFVTNFFSSCPEFDEWLAVYERQKRGAWHLHLLVIVREDIRQGIDWAALELGDYRSASPYLRGLWRLLRTRLPAFGFGRHELLPVRSNAEAMARYVGKYIGKHMGQRKPEDKGKRLISASKGWPRSSVTFAWYTDHGRLWRRNLGRLAHHLGISDLGGFSERYGSSWAYYLADVVRDVEQCLAVDPLVLDRLLCNRCGVKPIPSLGVA